MCEMESRHSKALATFQTEFSWGFLELSNMFYVSFLEPFQIIQPYVRIMTATTMLGK